MQYPQERQRDDVQYGNCCKQITHRILDVVMSKQIDLIFGVCPRVGGACHWLTVGRSVTPMFVAYVVG